MSRNDKGWRLCILCIHHRLCLCIRFALCAYSQPNGHTEKACAVLCSASAVRHRIPGFVYVFIFHSTKTFTFYRCLALSDTHPMLTTVSEQCCVVRGVTGATPSPGATDSSTFSGFTFKLTKYPLIIDGDLYLGVFSLKAVRL